MVKLQVGDLKIAVFICIKVMRGKSDGLSSLWKRCWLIDWENYYSVVSRADRTSHSGWFLLYLPCYWIKYPAVELRKKLLLAEHLLEYLLEYCFIDDKSTSLISQLFLVLGLVCLFVFGFPASNVVIVFHLKCSIERLDKNY